MRIKVKLEYKKQVWISDISDLNDQQFNQLKEWLPKSVNNVDHFSMKSNGEEFYFGNKILRKSIISIIYIDEIKTP